LKFKELENLGIIGTKTDNQKFPDAIEKIE
jgi:hypothetical protein